MSLLIFQGMGDRSMSKEKILRMQACMRGQSEDPRTRNWAAGSKTGPRGHLAQ